jgi:hypothetical protein
MFLAEYVLIVCVFWRFIFSLTLQAVLCSCLLMYGALFCFNVHSDSAC